MITKEASLWEMAVVLCFYQDSFSQIAYWGKVKKKRKRKLRYQIHECSTQKHSCILNHLLWVKVLSTKCMKRLLRQQTYLHTFVHVNSSEVNTHMQTYSPQCTIHWVAIFVHTSRASLLTTLFGKFCICVQIQVHMRYISIYTLYSFSPSHTQIHCILLRQCSRFKFFWLKINDNIMGF